MLMLPFTNSDKAFIVAERIRKQVENKEIKVANNIIKVTISGGIASLTNENSIEKLIEKADHNLYLAKTNGRNQIWVSEDM